MQRVASQMSHRKIADNKHSQ